MTKKALTHNISYPASAVAVVFGGAALRSISLSCRTGNRPQPAPACSFLRYGALIQIDTAYNQ
jgi:hypothetical protein